MVSDTSGQNRSQSGLPEYQPPHVVRMNGLRGGFGTCPTGEGNTTGACQTTGAANTGYDGCIAGTTNSFTLCNAGGVNDGPDGTCTAGGNKTPTP